MGDDGWSRDAQCVCNRGPTSGRAGQDGEHNKAEDRHNDDPERREEDFSQRLALQLFKTGLGVRAALVGFRRVLLQGQVPPVGRRRFRLAAFLS